MSGMFVTSSAVRPSPKEAAAAHLRILVVDDDRVMCESIAEILGAEGHMVRKAYSGRGALELVDQDGVDLLVSDLRMPHQSGIDLLREVRRSSPGLYVIIITGYGTVETAVEAMKLGAHDFIQKPFKSEHLLAAVGRVLDARRFKESLAGPDRSPADVLREAAANGVLGIWFGWGPSPADLPEGCRYLQLTDSETPAEGAIHGRDLDKVKDWVLQPLSRGTPVAVLLSGVDRFLAFHAWRDVLQTLEVLHTAVRDANGLFLLTARQGGVSVDQVHCLRELLGTPFVDEVVDSLSNPIRRASLLFAEAGPARFSDLMRAAGVDNSAKMAFHVRKLVQEELLEQADGAYVLTAKGGHVLSILRGLERDGAHGKEGHARLFLEP